MASGVIRDTAGNNHAGITNSTAFNFPTDISNRLATTAVLSSGGVISSAIDSAGDHDWVKIDLVVGRSYSFEVRGSSSSNGTLADPFLTLRNSAGAAILSSDDRVPEDGISASVTNLNSLIGTFRPVASDSYYLDVNSAVSSGTGTYQITAQSHIAPVQEAWARTLGFASPVSGPLVVTQGYGGDTSHGSPSQFGGSNSIRYAIDLSVDVGTRVNSIGDGVVVSIRADSTGANDTLYGSLGNFVTIDYGGGVFATFAHLASVSVGIGASLSAGAEIGRSGNTGAGTGPHLHLHFGTQLTSTSATGPQWANGTSNTIPPAFLQSFLSLDDLAIFDAAIPTAFASTDIIGTTDATNSTRTAVYPGALPGAPIDSDDDELSGSSVGDRIFGLSGNDRLAGNGGNDTLVGGAGNDRLWGNAGADTFVFRAGHGNDWINDFENGSDKLWIRGLENDVSDISIQNSNSNTLITFGADSILLVGISSSLIEATDFIFT